MTTDAWFGRVPDGWQAVPLYGIAAERKIPNKGLRETNLLSLSYGRIVQKNIDTNQGLLPTSFETYQIVDPGDIVLRMTDLQNDQRSLRSALVGETGIVTSAYLAMTLRDVDPRFLAYQFRAIDLMKVFYSMGGGLRQSIGFADLKRLPVLLPSLAVQRAITDYLDRETAQIDALIAKNEALITLLRERRAVAVDRAIGWGRTTDMETGKWLGGTPSGWALTPLRRWIRYITSGSRGWGQFYADRGSDIFLRIGDLQRDRLALRPVARQRVELPVGEEGVRARTHAGDLLISITADLGSVAVIDMADAGAYVSQHVALVRLDQEKLNSRYAAYVIGSSAGKTHFDKAAYGGTKVQLSLPDVKEMPIAVPPLNEQVQAVQHLDAVTDEVDDAIRCARRAIELACERRAALISAAVTGKLDVGVAA